MIPSKPSCSANDPNTVRPTHRGRARDRLGIIRRAGHAQMRADHVPAAPAAPASAIIIRMSPAQAISPFTVACTLA